MDMKTKDILEYEVKSEINFFKKLSNWLNIIAGIALLAAVFRKELLVLICLIAIIVLKLKLDMKSGEMMDYYRRKNNIPNKTRIKNMARENEL